MLFREIEEKTRKLFQLSAEELHRRGVEALLTQELRNAEAKLFSISRINEIQAAFETNRRFTEEQLKEIRFREDYYRIDHLKTQINNIKALLEQLRGYLD